MLTADLIIENLRAPSKKQALQVIAEKTASLYFGDSEALFDAILDRERIGSTGIGDGVAIPHVKLGGIDRVYGILARLETPVDYEALDSVPVDLIFLLLAPAESKMTQHLKALAQISRFMKDAETCAQLRRTADQNKIADLLLEWSRTQAA